MNSIVLPPDLATALAAEAARHGTTTELFALEVLHKSVPSHQDNEGNNELGTTLLEAMDEYIGSVSSEERYPGGSSLSEKTGRQFARSLVGKRTQGQQ